jgi:hypothetical protein
MYLDHSLHQANHVYSYSNRIRLYSYIFLNSCTGLSCIRRYLQNKKYHSVLLDIRKYMSRSYFYKLHNFGTAVMCIHLFQSYNWLLSTQPDIRISYLSHVSCKLGLLRNGGFKLHNACNELYRQINWQASDYSVWKARISCVEQKSKTHIFQQS